MAEGRSRRRRRGAAAGEVRISDPRAIRALAHPARLTIIDALYADEAELTATQCAALTGLTASAASYHLRALERWGLVIRGTPSADGRERPWKAAGRTVHVSTGGSEAASLADAAVLDTVLDRDRAALQTYLAGEHREPREWRDTPTASTSKAWLTAAELSTLVDDWHERIDGLRERADPTRRPAGARPVRLSLLTIPLPPDN